MSDEKIQQHWAELAEQLGLDPQSPPPPPGPVEEPRIQREQTPVVPPRTVVAPREAPAPGHLQEYGFPREGEQQIEIRHQPEGREPAPGFPGEPEHREEPPARLEEREGPPRLEDRETPPRVESRDRPPRPDDRDRPPRPDDREGSQRRRRGRRSGKGDRQPRTAGDAGDASREQEASAENQSLEKQSDRGPRRGRGRSRNRNDNRGEEIPVPPALDEETPDEVPEEIEKEEDVDTEELDTLSDWNVPSWTELIGSLYRPDR